jgi:hypothetical protein
MMVVLFYFLMYDVGGVARSGLNGLALIPGVWNGYHKRHAHSKGIFIPLQWIESS